MTVGQGQILWTAEQAAAATGGQTSFTWRATGVSIDSRTVQPGDLFIALSGPKFDGHDFVATALDNGAAAALVHGSADELAGECPAEKLLVVSETMTALETLGRIARDRTNARIIAVTGSVGKTGTKELFRLVLESQGRVATSEGNQNNHWGLPLSLARMPIDSEFGIFEMGMNHAGEIEPLTKIARPHVALITAVEPVHSAFFNSVEEIADAKAEVFQGVEPGGAAVINHDNRNYARLVAAAEAAGIQVVRSFGTADSATDRLLGFETDGEGSDVVAEIGGHRMDYRIGVPGRHWVMNSLAVLAAVELVGGSVTAAASRMVEMQGLTGRGRRHTVAFPGGDFVLIDESYNASPASVAAALDVLGQTRISGAGRRIAVLGDMLELGAESELLHAQLAEVLAARNIDLVFTAGQYMAALTDALPTVLRGGHASTTANLIPMVVAAVRPDDVITVKGSLGSRTGIIVDALLEMEFEGGDIPRAVNGE